METKVKEFELGKIVYHMPNVVEQIRILGKLGVSTNQTKNKDLLKRNELELVACAMDCLPGLISEIHAEKDGRKIETWDDAVKEREFASPLVEIATEVLSFVTSGDDSKKKAPSSGETATGKARGKSKKG